MHIADRKVSLPHFSCQPFNFVSFVDKNDCLRDREGIVKVTQCLKLVVFLFYSHEELLYTIESKLITLDQNFQGVIHELCGHV